jgi:hypothetical protein
MHREPIYAALGMVCFRRRATNSSTEATWLDGNNWKKEEIKKKKEKIREKG